MTVRMYSSLDAGAPALPNLSSQRFIDNLRIVLRACLVDGYGDKPGAGWTVMHDVADGFSLGNGEGIINFVFDTANTVVVYLMEAITDGTVALAGGVNRRSGPWFDGEVTSTRQKWFANMHSTTGGKSWALVADEKTCTILCQGNLPAGGAVDFPWASAQALHFGQYYPVLGGTGFLCLGGSSAPGSSMTLWGPGMSGTVLRHPFTGLVGQGPAPGYRAWVPHGATQNSMYIPGRFQPRVFQGCRAGASGGGVGLSGSPSSPNTSVYGGLLRGLLTEPVLTPTYLSLVLPALGLSAPVQDDRLRSIPVGGKELWPLFPHTSDLGGFVSLDSADWEPLWT